MVLLSPSWLAMLLLSALSKVIARWLQSSVNNNSNVGGTAGLTKVSQDGENAHEFIWRLK